jgi:hypothetical protein
MLSNWHKKAQAKAPNNHRKWLKEQFENYSHPELMWVIAPFSSFCETLLFEFL